jgi:hypothetical protein
MAMTDGEIRDRLRDLLAPADKDKRQRRIRYRRLTWFLGMPLGALLGTVAAIELLGLGDTGGPWVMLIGACIGVKLARWRKKKSDARAAQELALAFKAMFPQETGDFEAARQHLRQARTESRIEKDLLALLWLSVTPEAHASKQQDPFEKVVSQASKILAAMSKLGTIKSWADFKAFAKEHTGFSGGNGEAGTNGKGGLLGDFKKADGSASAGKSRATAPGAATVSSAPSPRYIPLDPYHLPADTAVDASGPGAKSPQNRQRPA